MRNLIHSISVSFCLLFIYTSSFSQYKEYKISANGDTVNAVTKDGLKTGKWIVEVGEIRGEPGYVEVGMYKKGVKNGCWRKYSNVGDLIGVENYFMGGKSGLQQYYNYLGQLEREEFWKGYNPDSPFDTIPIYGTGSGEIVDYKLVKAEPYSVRHGDWRYFDTETGRLLRTEKWELNRLVNPDPPKVVTKPAYEKPKKVEKTPEMLMWEKKNRGKKGAVRDGRTGI